MLPAEFGKMFGQTVGKGCPMLSIRILGKLSSRVHFSRVISPGLRPASWADPGYSGMNIGEAGCFRRARSRQTWPCSFRALCTSHNDTCTPCSADKRDRN